MTDTIDNISNNITDDQILYIHTKKIPAIKSLIEALKEIFRDVSIKFTPKVVIPNEADPSKSRTTGGMYITALNSNGNILVRLHLEADKFCYYKCQPDNNKNYIMLGVNMTNFFKLIKFLNNDDELYMIYNKMSQNQLNLQYVNNTKNLTTNYYLNLLDLKDENIVIGKQKFDFMISMSSNDFHGLIKNMSIIAEHVDIKFINTDTGYSLSFSCLGEFASQESVFNGSTSSRKDGDHDEKNMTINVRKNEDSDDLADGESKNNSNIIQGVYELKALSLFSRCSSLCPTIELYIKNDSPMVIKYRVADMGSVHLILTPANNNDEIHDDSDNDSDNDSDIGYRQYNEDE
jgi:proliferating cell nuclear antigen